MTIPGISSLHIARSTRRCPQSKETPIDMVVFAQRLGSKPVWFSVNPLSIMSEGNLTNSSFSGKPVRLFDRIFHRSNLSSS